MNRYAIEYPVSESCLQTNFFTGMHWFVQQICLRFFFQIPE